MITKHTPAAVAHSMRFRAVSNRYPLRVTEAYEGDLATAAAATDAEVAQRVAAWERANGTVGTVVRDWVAQGRDEGR